MRCCRYRLPPVSIISFYLHCINLILSLFCIGVSKSLTDYQFKLFLDTSWCLAHKNLHSSNNLTIMLFIFIVTHAHPCLILIWLNCLQFVTSCFMSNCIHRDIWFSDIFNSLPWLIYFSAVDTYLLELHDIFISYAPTSGSNCECLYNSFIYFKMSFYIWDETDISLEQLSILWSTRII